LGQSFLHGHWQESAVSRRPRVHKRTEGSGPVARPYLVGTAPGAGRARWIDCPVLRRGSRSKQRHKQAPATNNTFHTSGGSLTHASEGKARRVLKNIPTPGDLSASQGAMWLKVTEGCLAVVGHWDSAALLRERSGGQRAEAHAAESGHRAPTVASSTVQHRFRHHCRHAS
jgi:hypothetical protein